MVAARLTPVSPNTALATLAAGYQRVFGQAPTEDALLMIGGQSALETQHWQKLYDWNFANYTSVARGCVKRVEVTSDLCFAVYPDAVTGAAALAGWWKQYSVQIPASVADIDGVAAALQRGNYIGSQASTEEYQLYAQKMWAIGQSLRSSLGGTVVTPPAPSSGPTFGQVVAIGAAGVVGLFFGTWAAEGFRR